jgi:hypothetical protein
MFPNCRFDLPDRGVPNVELTSDETVQDGFREQLGKPCYWAELLYVSTQDFMHRNIEGESFDQPESACVISMEHIRLREQVNNNSLH